MANKKITELTELTAANIANNDVLAIVDVGGNETKKVSISSLRDIFDDNVAIDTAKIVYGLDAANTNISALSVNTLPLIGGTVTGATTFSNAEVMSINAAGNVKIARGLAVGYVNKVPGANLDVNGNAYISGTVTLGTALSVSSGGTGATSLTDGGVLLGSGTGAVTAMSVLGDGEMIVGDGSTDPVAESGATLRTSIGVGTGDSPQFTAVNIGAATDTTVSRASAGDINVEGNIVYRAGGTDVAIADGGTGAGTATAGFDALSPMSAEGDIIYGGTSGTVTRLAKGSDDEVLTLASGIPSWAASGGSISAGDVLVFYSANTTGNVRFARGVAVGYSGNKVPGANLDVNGNAYISGSVSLGTALTVGSGGTGATSLTDGGVLLGSGTSAVTAMSVLGDGEMIVGDGSTDPVAESGATLRTSIGVGTGDSPQFTAVNIGAASDTTVSRASAGDINVEGNIVYRAGGTDVPVADGGTGASTLTDGGVLLGSGTGAITAMSVLSDGEMIVGDGSTDPVAESGATLRTSIGIGTGDTPQFYGANVSGNASINRSVAIGYTDGRVPQANLDVKGNTYISGSVSLGTALTVGSGGTGATSLTDGGVLLGSGTSAVTAMSVLGDGEMIVGNGSTDPVAESGATLRTSIGVGTGDSPQFTAVNIGAATDTTVSRASAGDINVEGNIVYRAGGTDVPVADGGTGASTLTDGGVLLGSGTGAITAMSVLGDGELIVGDGSTDPVAESGATLRTSIGVGTGDSPQFTAVNIGAATDTTVSRASAGDINVEGNIVYRAGGTDVPVADGGTGASTLTDGGVLLGSGTGAITAMSVLGDGELIVGDGSTDPVAESGDTLRTSIGVGAAASGTVMQIYGANTTGNVKLARGLAIGYANAKVPGANLDVKGNAYIGANVYVANTQNFNSTNYSGFPYDIAFTAGFDSDMAKEDVATGTYGELVMGRPVTVVGEAGYVDTAPTGAKLIVDIEKNGTSIYSTRPEFATSATSLTAGVLGATAVFISGDRITFKVDQIGSSEPGEGVRFTLLCKV